MSTKLLIVALLEFGLAAGGAVAFAGNSSGGGAEFITTERNPWFIGNAPVRYCVERSTTTFSPNDAAIDAALQSALANWAQTISAMRPAPTTFDIFAGSAKNLTTSFIREVCNESTELHFFFGVSNQLIRESLQHLAHYTLSFAKQTEFDPLLGRAKGIIWLSGDIGPEAFQGPHRPGEFWGFGASLYNVLLHEIGHVYGFGHSSNGIMQANAPIWAVLGGSESRYSTCDKYMQLWQRRNDGIASGWAVPNEDQPAFEQLFRVSLRQSPTAALRSTGDQENFILELNANNQILGSFRLRKLATWRLPTAGLNGIVGRYQRASSSGEDFNWPVIHEFVSSSTNDLILSGDVNGQAVRFVVQSTDGRIRLVFTTDSDPVPHHFDIEFPMLERLSTVGCLPST